MPVVVILGMHRSGTSLLCRSLNAAGLWLGNDVETVPDQDNLEGNSEAREARAINDRILEISGGAWHMVPQSLRTDAEIDQRMENFLAELTSHPCAGWKDPRTTLTWPCWLPHLPADRRIVAAFRHPVAVARSLQVRDGWTLEKGLALWTEYNKRLLEVVARERAVLWCPFDADPRHLGLALERIAQELNLPHPERALSQFNPLLRHHQVESSVLDAHTQRCYELLCEQAGQTPLLPGKDSAGISIGNGMDEASMKRFAEALRLQSDVLQRHFRHIQELACRLGQMEHNFGLVREHLAAQGRKAPHSGRRLAFRLIARAGQLAGLPLRILRGLAGRRTA